MGKIFSTCKKKVKGKEDKYTKPEQPTDEKDDITIATSEGGTLEKDKEEATSIKSKPSSIGSNDTTKEGNKKPTNTKKPKKKKHKAAPDISDSSDTDSSTDSSDSDIPGYKKPSKKIYKNKRGGKTIITKTVNVGGTYTKIRGINNMVVNIGNNDQPKQNIPKKPEVKTRYEPYNDKTKDRFLGKSRVGASHGNFVYTHDGEHSRIEGIDISELKIRAEKSICKIQFLQPNGMGNGSGFRIGPPDMNFLLTAAHVLAEMIKIVTSTSNMPNIIQKNINIDRGDVFCVFNHNTDDYQPDERDKFFFKPVAHFIDYETDTAILELKPNEYGTPMPPPLTRFCMPEPTSPFYLIGHPSGGKKKACLSENIINMLDPTTSNHINIVRRYCEEAGLSCEVAGDHRLDNPARWLFHVTDKFTKGASGCPGLVFTPPYGVSVVTVLLRGYPDFFYDKNATFQQKADLPPNYCVEQGANMDYVFDNLREKNQSLYYKIIG